MIIFAASPTNHLTLTVISMMLTEASETRLILPENFQFFSIAHGLELTTLTQTMSGAWLSMNIAPITRASL
jgi:hypothetical protein